MHFWNQNYKSGESFTFEKYLITFTPLQCIQTVSMRHTRIYYRKQTISPKPCLFNFNEIEPEIHASALYRSRSIISLSLGSAHTRKSSFSIHMYKPYNSILSLASAQFECFLSFFLLSFRFYTHKHFITAFFIRLNREKMVV